MFLDELFKEYLSEDSKFEVQDILQIPFTRVGIHALELDPDILAQEGAGFLKKIENNIEYLKSISVTDELFYDGQEAPETLYDLIRKWNQAAMSQAPNQELEFDDRMLDYLKDVKPAYFYSVLYESVLNGEMRKRSVRLHFSDTTLPFVLISKGVVKQINLNLSSVSREGMLLHVDPELKQAIEESVSFTMIIDPKKFFDSWFQSSEDGQESDQPGPRRDELEKWKGVDTVKFKIDRDKIQFAQNELEKASNKSSDNEHFLCLPFSALHDALLFTTEDWERLFDQELDNLREYINKLICK